MYFVVRFNCFVFPSSSSSSSSSFFLSAWPKVIEKIQAGYRLPRPSKCPEAIYANVIVKVRHRLKQCNQRRGGGEQYTSPSLSCDCRLGVFNFLLFLSAWCSAGARRGKHALRSKTFGLTLSTNMSNWQRTCRWAPLYSLSLSLSLSLFLVLCHPNSFCVNAFLLPLVSSFLLCSSL